MTMRANLPTLHGLAAFACAVALGWAAAAPAASPAAETVTAEAPPVGPFRRIHLSGQAELVLVQGEREAVTVDASPKSRSRVRVRSEDNELQIDVSEARPWWAVLGSGRPPTVTVHFRDLEALTMSGAVQVSAARIDAVDLRVKASGATTMNVPRLHARTLRFSGSGAVKTELGGRIREQDVSISGAGEYRAPDLVTEAVVVSVSGAGVVVVNATKTLAATISGAGTVEYFGDPEVKQKVSGAGRISRRSAEFSPTGLRVADSAR
jgi:hypothetical protein